MSRHFIIGSAVHALVLEGKGVFRARFSTKFRNFFRQTLKLLTFQKRLSRTILTSDEYRDCLTMRDSIYNNKIANKLLTSKEFAAEKKLNYIEQGKKKHIRLDGITIINNRHTIIELKTISGVRNISQDIKKFDYHKKAQKYKQVYKRTTGHKVDDYVMIFVDKHEFEGRHSVVPVKMNDKRPSYCKNGIQNVLEEYTIKDSIIDHLMHMLDVIYIVTFFIILSITLYVMWDISTKLSLL